MGLNQQGRAEERISGVSLFARLGEFLEIPGDTVATRKFTL